MTIHNPFCLNSITRQLVLHPCLVACPQMPRVWWTSTSITTVIWTPPTYSSAWSTTSLRSRRVAPAMSSAQRPCRWTSFCVVRFCVRMWLFMMPCGVLRNWPWERKALNVWCPSWNAWSSGVKTNTSTLTLRPASVSQLCVICQDYMTFFQP